MKLKKYNEYVDWDSINRNKSAVETEVSDMKANKKTQDDIFQDYLDKGELSKYLNKNGKKFTFGILNAIFDDALDAKKKRNMTKGGYKFLHRAIPIIGGALSPIIWLLGTVFGSLRAFNKIIKNALENPGNNYPDFIKNVIINTMSVAEGDIKPLLGDDQFYNAFVVSDDIIKVLRKDLLYEFATDLANKMSKEDIDDEVPHKYIENELKKWLSNKYDLSYTFPTNKL
jgi:hypothetical protein